LEKTFDDQHIVITQPRKHLVIRYLFAWAPAVVVVGTVVILSCAYLALIVFMLAAVVAIPLLAWAVVVAPYLLVRGLYRSWREVPAIDASPVGKAHGPTSRV
jgi:hypothetical protein